MKIVEITSVNTLPRMVVAGGDGGSRSQHVDDSPRLQPRFGVQSIPVRQACQDLAQRPGHLAP